jgi:hypothetical protein
MVVALQPNGKHAPQINHAKCVQGACICSIFRFFDTVDAKFCQCTTPAPAVPGSATQASDWHALCTEAVQCPKAASGP